MYNLTAKKFVLFGGLSEDFKPKQQDSQIILKGCSEEERWGWGGQDTLKTDGVAIMVNKGVRNAVLGCDLINARMISVHFQGKPFSIMVFQIYAPTSNTEEAEVEQFYEDLQDLLKLTPKKDVLFIIGDWNAKLGHQETPGVKIWTTE